MGTHTCILYEFSPVGNPGNPPGTLFADRASWYITELEYLATPLVAAVARGFGDHWRHTHTHTHILYYCIHGCHITSATTTIIHVGTIIIIIIDNTVFIVVQHWGDRHFIADCVLHAYIYIYYIVRA